MVNQAATDAMAIHQYKKKSNAKETWRRMCRNKLSIIGLGIFSIFVIFLIFADALVPYEKAILQDMGNRYATMSAEHWLGTDLYGRDILARIIHGTRNSLSIGVAATAIGITLGAFLAALAGYFGGKVDMIIMRITDTIYCIPFMLLGLSIVAALGPGLVNILIALTVTAIPNFVRIIRSAILPIVEQDYIEAGKACGAGHGRNIITHVLPNAVGPIIVQATMQVGTMIIYATAFSYLGLGIQLPKPEWGSMLAEGKEFMLTAPHMVIFPGLAIVLVALSLNLIGDGLRDALDPRLKD